MIGRALVLGAALASMWGCGVLGIGPSGTCIKPGSFSTCTVNMKDFVCKTKSPSTEKNEFYAESGAAGLARCKSLGYELPRDPARRQQAEADLSKGEMVQLSQARR